MLVVGERNMYFLKMFESDAWNLIVMSQVCYGISGKFQKSSIIIEPKSTFLFNNSTQSLFSNWIWNWSNYKILINSLINSEIQ